MLALPGASSHGSEEAAMLPALQAVWVAISEENLFKIQLASEVFTVQQFSSLTMQYKSCLPQRWPNLCERISSSRGGGCTC